MKSVASVLQSLVPQFLANNTIIIDNLAQEKEYQFRLYSTRGATIRSPLKTRCISDWILVRARNRSRQFQFGASNPNNPLTIYYQ